MSAYDCTQSDPHAGRERWQQRYAEAEATGRVRDADFTTLSGAPQDPVYGPRDGDTVEGFERIGWPGSTPTPVACTPPATAAGRGPSGSSRASAARGRPTSATR